MKGKTGSNEVKICALKSISGTKSTVGGIEYSYNCNAKLLLASVYALLSIVTCIWNWNLYFYILLWIFYEYFMYILCIV